MIETQKFVGSATPNGNRPAGDLQPAGNPFSKMTIVDQINKEFDAKTAGRGPYSRGDLASRVLWRTFGRLEYRLNNGTPAQRKLAYDLLVTMLAEIQTVKDQ